MRIVCVVRCVVPVVDLVNQVNRSKLNLVDLAGSEKWRTAHLGTKPNNSQITEMNAINQSLSCLGAYIFTLAVLHLPSVSAFMSYQVVLLNIVLSAASDVQVVCLCSVAVVSNRVVMTGKCISALGKAGRTHIPFRESKLTRLLQVPLL